MADLQAFIKVVHSEFPDDRLTWQKSIATFHPETSEEAARLFKLANDHGQALYITGFGNNIDPIGEPFVNMLSVRTDRLNQLLEIAPEDFYVRVGGGYPIREINRHLEETGLFFPPSGLPYVGSAGGAVAANITAMVNGHRFPIKKYLIKAEVVTPQGEIITPGSVCFKSVSGYDIVKIFAPSWGLLGLLVSLTFRVLPASARDEYRDMTMLGIERENFLSGLEQSNSDVDAVYSRKVKAKFDPNNILPLVLPGTGTIA